MEHEENEEVEILLFHNPNAVARIALWTNIVAWVVFGLTVIAFVSQTYYIVVNWAGFSSQYASIADKIRIFSQYFNDSFHGIVSFLLLRGVSLGLKLLQDLFYGNTEDEDYEEVMVVEPAA
jgi:hypothetical protein